jgi:hypothetical protein
MEDTQRFFAGNSREPLQVLIAFDEGGIAVGFIELSIRSYAEGCVSDNVAFIEGWYVSPTGGNVGTLAPMRVLKKGSDPSVPIFSVRGGIFG